ncbi:ZIP family metal transporter [Maribacter aurantiacus]|uniref:ZIP family metal transporter n=1 Tax=Maribacter aurantiacus TaxID=1882343 RepID=A0A5R8LT14_9FLAO|nr:ZIP family metal transporter [Maribacter aurantiacus]TLF40338.1 ZIP family metal transporter [Maribacter aurantiacus]
MIYILPILGVLLSFVFVFFTKPKKKEHFRLLLAFSGAFLLALTIFELLPEVYEHSNTKSIGIFIMLGILLQIFLEFFSKGAEHGHVHLSKTDTNFPWLLFGSLSIHSLLEGIPISENNSIIYGILIHKIAIAVILSFFLLNSKMKTIASALFILLFSMMTPLGTYLSQSFGFIMDNLMFINAIVIGVLLHISTVILFESSEGHKFNLRKLLVIVLGITIAYFI